MSARPVPVVLLHGLTDASTCWPTVLPRYAGDGRAVVALDARGHGGTPLPDEPFTVAALAADAAEALRALDLGPALVVGHSMGGVTAEELALTAPELVAGLVLEDPAWRTAKSEGVDAPGADGSVVGVAVAAGDVAGPGGARDAVRDGGAAGGAAGPGAWDAVRDDGAARTVPGGAGGGGERTPGGVPDWLAPAIAAVQGRTVEQIAARGRLDNPRWSEAEVLGWAEAKAQVDPRLAEVPHDWLGRDWVEALADVRVPVTLLTADPGLGVVTDRQAARAAELLGDRLTHVAFPDAGHNIRREAPDRYLAALDAAVARADAAR
ncbi:alpha/beta hydrolase [Cellulomonas sp. PS-H5]|uniref:alpha/beta hydrolase n=1 Tax=Cellulomonas sp. PS-H5 TaxID=2820400 RepID=UPI001C4F3F28|nr:alpha/beta hydrolase [Cellulomonas sp. PS-H5]MBW0256084.1 alpha/beta hydrolase [Cellulomonas sp. PS-H5]